MNHPNFSELSVLYINCTLKKSPEKSHTATLMDVSKSILDKEKVKHEEIRFIDEEVATGIYPDMTEYGWKTDAWPKIFKSDGSRYFNCGNPHLAGRKIIAMRQIN